MENLNMYILIFSIFGFFMSASITSFLTAMESRNWKDIMSRSKCLCGENIKAIGLIPVFGSIFYKFTCPSCKKKFSKKMAFTEFISGFTFVSLFIYGFNILNMDINYLNIILLSISSGALGIIIYEDLESFMVSDIYAMLGIFPLLYIFSGNLYMFAVMITGIFIFKLLADNYIAWKLKDSEAIALGEGDILIFGLVGILATSYLFIPHAILAISIVGIILKLTIFRKSEIIPMVPAIIIGLDLFIVYKSIFQ